ncbi:MAG: PilZ domain-containing protein [Desulfobacteraceae bacterium]|nr:PilZ domain-containing protein [Desulfobacteraceae bacterium]
MNMESKARIVLVVSDQALLSKYLTHLSAHPVEIKTVGSIKALEMVLSKEPFNGIIIDLKTKLNASRDQKELAYELLEHYPVLQSRIIPETGKLQALPFGKAQGDVTLEAFLTSLCPCFDARTVRTNPRKPIFFNVLLSKDGAFTAEQVERTFTLNVSRGGCFIASTQAWITGTNAAFILKELSIRTPIVADIRWCVPWGKKMAVPGIGVKFEDIDTRQAQELIEKFGL